MLDEVTVIAEEIHRRTNDYADEEWLNAERERVDACTAEVSDYLEAHKDDPPSSAESYTQEWLHKHAAEEALSASVDPSEDVPVDEFSGLTLDDQRQKGAVSRTHPEHPASSGQHSYGGYFGGGDVKVSFPSALSSHLYDNTSQPGFDPHRLRFEPSSYQQSLDAAQNYGRQTPDDSYLNTSVPYSTGEFLFSNPSFPGGLLVPPASSMNYPASLFRLSAVNPTDSTGM